MDLKRPKSKQPIPQNAKKVFSGVLFSAYQWEQKLFNGEKMVFEKLERADIANVIPVTEEGKLILCEQEQPGTEPFVGCWGGRLDEGEAPLEAAKRELMEEAGMEAKEYILWDAIQPVEKIDWAIFTFIAKGVETIQKPSLDGGEKIKLMPVSFDEFLKIAARENFRDKELALKVFRAMQDPAELKRMRELFTPNHKK